MRNKILLVAVLLFFSNEIIIAQQNTFSKVYYAGHASRIINSYDNAYLISSAESSLITKIDTNGDIIWSKWYNDAFNVLQNLQIRAFIPSFDSCHVLAGDLYNSVSGLSNIFYAKINSSGDTVWAGSMSLNNSNLYLTDITQTSDSGYILTGYSIILVKLFIAKISKTGALEWSKYLVGSNGTISASAVKQTTDNGYIISGSENGSSSKAILVKLNLQGDFEWAKKYQDVTSSAYTRGADVIVNNTGFYCYFFAESCPLLCQTDNLGNLLWNKTYFNLGTPFLPINPKIHRTSDSAYIFIDPMGFNGRLIKTDSSGDIIWSKVLMFYGGDVIDASDKGFMILGNGPLFGVKAPSDPQFGLIKVDSSGNGMECVFSSFIDTVQRIISATSFTLSSYTGGIQAPLHLLSHSTTMDTRTGCVDFLGYSPEIEAQMSMQIYPNPTNGLINIITNGSIKAELFDVFGRRILTTTNSVIDLSLFPHGLYFIKVENQKGEILTQKIVYE